jgi:glyoxylase-like metal-dependent hydrolase (beta-lactamase superfamily II)
MPDVLPLLAEAHRELAPDVFWLPNCLGRVEPTGWMHVHASCYLVLGAERTLLVDTGHPAHWQVVSAVLDRLLGERSLDFVFPTHPEIPHAGNLARLLAKYPSALAVGDVRDYHLFYPECTPRLSPRVPGERLELGGGTTLTFVEAAIRDLPNTLWGHLEPQAVLFVSDGVMLSHHAGEDDDAPLHAPGECLRTTGEIEWPPDLAQITFLTDRSISWMRYADAGESRRRIEAAVAERPTELIAPTHGNVVARPREVFAVLGAAWTRIAEERAAADAAARAPAAVAAEPGEAHARDTPGP